MYYYVDINDSLRHLKPHQCKFNNIYSQALTGIWILGLLPIHKKCEGGKDRKNYLGLTYVCIYVYILFKLRRRYEKEPFAVPLPVPLAAVVVAVDVAIAVAVVKGTQFPLYLQSTLSQPLLFQV